MSLDVLLAELEARAVTSVTDAIFPDVTLEPLQMLDCTAVTAVTPENIIATIECPLKASDMRDLYDECVAIAEFEGGLCSDDAEDQATQELGARHCMWNDGHPAKGIYPAILIAR